MSEIRCATEHFSMGLAKAAAKMEEFARKKAMRDGLTMTRRAAMMTAGLRKKTSKRKRDE